MSSYWVGFRVLPESMRALTARMLSNEALESMAPMPSARLVGDFELGRTLCPAI
jgi:hypothetical protein